MKFFLPKPFLSRLMRAITEFDMISSGDRILIGLSGGKDSLFLTFALACLRDIMPHKVQLHVLTIDPQFTDTFDPGPLTTFCADLDIPFALRKADIAGIIAANQGKDPCFTCAFFRRGAMNRYAREIGCNKIAYAHHHDDAVETFLMGQLYAGQLKTFLPVTPLSRTGLTVIRPLIYFRERELKESIALHGQAPLDSPCPLNGKTKRQEIKEIIAAWEQINPSFYTHLASAMRSGTSVELWPPIPEREELHSRHRTFWQLP
ncbi:MAG TPA: tRNA 2-thiocytidine biosynthesis TtcA family protein [Patescibacteria group bacterium]|nr:tRNA 2-thiocytidine biosynthesis TtcA family protein [Patescibacteria group bacterium]